jgi:hypothetical protein
VDGNQGDLRVISIHIDCEPGQLDVYLAEIGFMRRPFVGATLTTEVRYAGPAEPERLVRQGEPPTEATPLPISEEQSNKRRPGRPKRQETAPPAPDEQDAADEKAEAEKNKPAELTHNDVREAISRYSKKHGPQAAIANIRAILGSSIEAVPLTQETLRTAIDKIDAATAAPLPKKEEPNSSLFGVGEKEPEPEPEPRAEKKEVNEAARQYGIKYDGTSNPKEMVHTATDIRAILSSALNIKVVDFNSFPDEPLICGRAKMAIMKAIEENPFKREVRA